LEFDFDAVRSGVAYASQGKKKSGEELGAPLAVEILYERRQLLHDGECSEANVQSRPRRHRELGPALAPP
jgi:hypothetical protein